MVFLFQFKLAFADNNRRANYLVADAAYNILNTLEPNALALSYGDSITGPLWYYQSTGQRPDVIIVAVALVRFDWYANNIINKYGHIGGKELLDEKDVGQRLKTIIGKNITERPLYSVFFNSSNDNLLEKYFNFVPNGLTFRILPKGSQMAKEITTSNKNVWDKYNLRNLKSNYRKDTMLNELAKYYALTLFRNGIAYFDQGFFDESVDLLEKSIQIYPQPITQRNLDFIKSRQSNKIN